MGTATLQVTCTHCTSSAFICGHVHGWALTSASSLFTLQAAVNQCMPLHASGTRACPFMLLIPVHALSCSCLSMLTTNLLMHVYASSCVRHICDSFALLPLCRYCSLLPWRCTPSYIVATQQPNFCMALHGLMKHGLAFLHE